MQLSIGSSFLLAFMSCYVSNKLRTDMRRKLSKLFPSIILVSSGSQALVDFIEGQKLPQLETCGKYTLLELDCMHKLPCKHGTSMR